MTRQELEALAVASYGHKEWQDMSDRELDHANEDAWNAVACELRALVADGHGIDDARRVLDARLADRLRGDEWHIARALKSRATKADIRFASHCVVSLTATGCQQGFVWDVEL